MKFSILGLIYLIYLESLLCGLTNGATLTPVTCETSPCAGQNNRIEFRLSGTLPATAGRLVTFYKDSTANPSPCLVDRLDPCNAATSCGCSESGGVRTFHYNLTSVNAAVNGNWFTVLDASDPSETVQSPSCQIQVNNMCNYLEVVSCPETVQEKDTLYISYSQLRAFPPTAGEALSFIIDGKVKTPQASLMWKNCPTTSQDAGCTTGSGLGVFYYNRTALRDQSGDWTIHVDASTGGDTISSPACQVEVRNDAVEDVAKILVIAGAIVPTLCATVVIVLVFVPLAKIDKKWRVGLAFVGPLPAFSFVVALGVHNVGTNGVLIRRISPLFISTGVFIAWGIIITLCCIGIGIWIITSSSAPTGATTKDSIEATPMESNGSATGNEPSRRR